MKLVALFCGVILATCSGQKNRVGSDSDTGVDEAADPRVVEKLDGDTESDKHDSLKTYVSFGKNATLNDTTAVNGNNESYSNTDSENKRGNEDQDSEITLTFIVSNPYSGVETAETRIIKDAKTLKKFYSQINRTRKPGLPIPNIDFSKEMVVVRCSGIKGDGATPTLSVQEVSVNEIVLDLVEEAKTSNPSSITSPFSVYRMPITDKQVIVRE